MISTIDNLARRRKRAIEEDGLNDILGGIGFLAITWMHYTGMRFQAAIHGHNFQASNAYREGQIFFLVGMATMFAVILGARHGVKYLRDQFVYPRLGYAIQRVAPERRQKLILLAFAVAMIVLTPALARVLPSWSPDIMVLMMGAIIGVTYIYHFATVGFARHLVVAIISLVAASLLFLAHLPWEHACGWLVILLGICLIISGAFPFATILRLPVLSEQD